VQSLYTSVPVAVALVLVQLVQTRSTSTQPSSAHVTLIPAGSKLGEVQSAYTSMLVSTLDDGTGVTDREAAGVGVSRERGPGDDTRPGLACAGELDGRAPVAAVSCPGWPHPARAIIRLPAAIAATTAALIPRARDAMCHSLPRVRWACAPCSRASAG
jgi:hypothetical protein